MDSKWVKMTVISPAINVILLAFLILEILGIIGILNKNLKTDNILLP